MTNSAYYAQNVQSGRSPIQALSRSQKDKFYLYSAYHWCKLLDPCLWRRDTMNSRLFVCPSVNSAVRPSVFTHFSSNYWLIRFFWSLYEIQRSIKAQKFLPTLEGQKDPKMFQKWKFWLYLKILLLDLAIIGLKCGPYSKKSDKISHVAKRFRRIRLQCSSGFFGITTERFDIFLKTCIKLENYARNVIRGKLVCNQLKV